MKHQAILRDKGVSQANGLRVEMGIQRQLVGMVEHRAENLHDRVGGLVGSTDQVDHGLHGLHRTWLMLIDVGRDVTHGHPLDPRGDFTFARRQVQELTAPPGIREGHRDSLGPPRAHQERGVDLSAGELAHGLQVTLSLNVVRCINLDAEHGE